jgi:hypothetical protein
VIHFSGAAREKRDASVRRTTMDEFMKGAVPETVSYRNPLPPDVVVQRAESHLGDTRYSLLHRNCEHFARWCATNQWRSRQVVRAAAVTAVAVCVTGAVGVARLVRAIRPRRG